MREGVVVGCDASQEWMLPWWWIHYRAHNRFPVAFADLGMSARAADWCARRGALYRVPVRTDVCAWFAKPRALCGAPFDRSLWLDLDCETRGDLSPFFAACENPAGIALVAETSFGQHKFSHFFPGELAYNSGAVCCMRESQVLQAWERACSAQPEAYEGDQDALSHLLTDWRGQFASLSSAYNWIYLLGGNPDAVVFHWIGPWGKRVIAQQAEMLAAYPFLDGF
jgi:hypothetical protein